MVGYTEHVGFEKKMSLHGCFVGSTFWRRGVEQLKALSPMVARQAGGVERKEADEDCSVREGVYNNTREVGVGGFKM